jgi:predicted AAA+ superfamily ATPase
MDRYALDIMRKELGRKEVFISGPRQVGKTTLAKKLFAKDQADYLVWDVPEGR